MLGLWMALGFRDFQGLGSKALENAWCKPYCKSIDVSATYFLYVYIYIHTHTYGRTYVLTYIHTYIHRQRWFRALVTGAAIG